MQLCLQLCATKERISKNKQYTVDPFVRTSTFNESNGSGAANVACDAEHLSRSWMALAKETDASVYQWQAMLRGDCACVNKGEQANNVSAIEVTTHSLVN
jgi:hypothetical protein